MASPTTGTLARSSATWAPPSVRSRPTSIDDKTTPPNCPKECVLAANIADDRLLFARDGWNGGIRVIAELLEVVG